MPVIATAVGGTAELIEHGETGLLAERPQDAAARLVELLSSPALAARLREGARRRVSERFSLARMVEAHEALYESALRSDRRPSSEETAPVREPGE